MEKQVLFEVKDLCKYFPASHKRSVKAVDRVTLNMEEVDYDIDGHPVFCSNEYFVDGIFRHTVMRKKL